MEGQNRHIDEIQRRMPGRRRHEAVQFPMKGFTEADYVGALMELAGG